MSRRPKIQPPRCARLAAKAAIFQGDAAVEADVVAMFSGVERELGALDGVVSNAGSVAPSMPLADMDAGRIRRVFEVNIIGAYLAHASARAAFRGTGADTAVRSCSCLLPPHVAARPSSISITPGQKLRSTT
jgi:NAD(P)-dependent dehydrogenase (short-subunit alcohol dehydrogenase family)